MKWVVRLCALVFLLTTATLVIARRQDSGWIAFTAYADDGASVFMMTGDGGAARRVTPRDLCATAPQWSSDARWIAFHSSCNAAFELMRIRPNGSSRQLVGKGLAYVGHWSPDGRWVVLARGAPDYDQLYLVDARTGADRLLVENHAYPQWSPDGNWVYTSSFYAAESNLDRIHVATGRAEHLLPVGASFPTRLSWSPDGGQIVFGMTVVQDDALFLMSPDGSALQMIPVTIPSPRVAEPQWSPDGEWIAFLGGDVFNTHQIYRVRPDGRALGQILQHAGRVWNLQWSSDGAWLLFEAQTGNKRDIFRIRPDGSGLQNLTPGPGNFSAPQYAPVAGLGWHPALMMVAALGVLVVPHMKRFFT